MATGNVPFPASSILDNRIFELSSLEAPGCPCQGRFKNKRVVTPFTTDFTDSKKLFAN